MSRYYRKHLCVPSVHSIALKSPTKGTNFMKHLCLNIQRLQCSINLTDLQGLQGALYGQKSISCNTQTYPDIPYTRTIQYSKAKEAFINPKKTHFAIIHFFLDTLYILQYSNIFLSFKVNGLYSYPCQDAKLFSFLLVVQHP